MSVSVLRSVARAVAQGLGPEVEVRITIEEWGAFSRPWARVGWATPGTASTHGATHRDHRRTLSVNAYPVEGMNAESSMVEAERVAGVVSDVFTKGVDPDVVSSHNPRRAHPRRLPLFDYSGVGLHEPGPAEPVAFMRVAESPSVEAFADAANDQLYIVAATIPLGWSEGLQRPDPGPVVERVIGGHVP